MSKAEDKIRKSTILALCLVLVVILSIAIVCIWQIQPHTQDEQGVLGKGLTVVVLLSAVFGGILVADIYRRFKKIETKLTDANSDLAAEINERAEAEQKLTDEHNLLRTLVDNLPDMIFVKDIDGRFIICNASIVHFVDVATHEDVIGKTDADFFPKELADRFRSDEQKIIKTGKPLIDQEEISVDKCGNKRWILTTKLPLRDSDGKVVGLVGISYDHSDRMLMEEESRRLTEALEAKNKELQSVIHVTSHDLKTPLVNIIGFSQELSLSFDQIKQIIAEDGLPENLAKKIMPILDEDVPEAIDLIKASSSKMAALLDSLLKLARLGHEALSPENLKMNEMISNIAKTVEFQAKQQRAEIEVDKLPDCFGDGPQVNQIFSNLISNALKYLDSDRQGVVRITGYKQDGSSVYCVEDNGLGIDEYNLENIFKLFYRVNPAEGQGDGMGLAIVRQIVSRHNGRVWASSEPGVGSKFFIALTGPQKS